MRFAECRLGFCRDRGAYIWVVAGDLFAMLVSSTLSQFSQPSGLKLFKIHLEERLIQQGMAVYQTIYAVFMIFGPVIGTFAYQRLGIDLSITITGVAFLLSAAALSFIPRDEKVKKAENATNIFQEMKSGVRYVLAKRNSSCLAADFLLPGSALVSFSR